MPDLVSTIMTLRGDLASLSMPWCLSLCLDDATLSVWCLSLCRGDVVLSLWCLSLCRL